MGFLLHIVEAKELCFLKKELNCRDIKTHARIVFKTVRRYWTTLIDVVSLCVLKNSCFYNIFLHEMNSKRKPKNNLYLALVLHYFRTPNSHASMYLSNSLHFCTQSCFDERGMDWPSSHLTHLKKLFSKGV